MLNCVPGSKERIVIECLCRVKWRSQQVLGQDIKDEVTTVAKLTIDPLVD